MSKSIFQNNRLSIFAIGLVVIVSVFIRFSYHSNNSTNGYNATTWDAFGYYAYLPATFIYKDVKKLEWYKPIEEKYHVSGGVLYQADTLKNGNLSFKYLGGVAVLQTPFFFIGHGVAHMTDAPEDGFSWPYQYAIIWGALFYFLLGIIVLRKVLLRYFSDTITAATILLICLASNLLQYISVDGAMSHSFIFPLYSLVIWWTIRWHETAKWKYVFGFSLLVGLASISRPTELIMLFIPLLWLPNENSTWKAKKAFILQHKSHILIAIIACFIGVLPQLIYWKFVTGSWVHNVGSKWFFLNPWWRVLIGFEKGWFIYTPVALFFVIGLFFMKLKPYRKAVLTFCLLNIWIIISWSDWRYGASYSTRALTQSYPVFAFALASFLTRIKSFKWQIVSATLSVYLICLNLFQIWQYNSQILHYDHMNFSYYKAIYWDSNPTALDYSLMDQGKIPDDFTKKKLLMKQLQKHKSIWNYEILRVKTAGNKMVHIKAKLYANSGLESSNFHIDCFGKDSLLSSLPLRTMVPFAKNKQWMNYEAFFEIPEKTKEISWNINSFDTLRIKFLSTKIEIGNESK